MTSRRGIDLGLVVFLSILVEGCATESFVAPAAFEPAALRERTETVVEEGVRVSAAIPSRDEMNTIFGVDLSSRKIQPVWLEIENNTDRRLHFMRTGLDPEYFAPREVAFLFYGSLSDEGRKNLDRHLESLSFQNPIAPGATVSGRTQPMQPSQPANHVRYAVLVGSLVSEVT